MVTVYVMVKANTGEANQLRHEIERLDGVERAFIVAGDVDIVVRATLDSTADVKDLVADGMHAIGGVADTSTYIAMG